MSDFISRQSLIDALNKFAPEHYTALVNSIIMKEPSAVPTCNKTEQVEDCISRQAAIEHYRVTDPAGTFAYCDSIIEFLESLPSVEPHYDLDGYSSRLWKAAYERGKAEAERKKGKWILQEDKAQPLYGWHICSECGAYIGEPSKYCSECGSDMRGEEDECNL